MAVDCDLSLSGFDLNGKDPHIHSQAAPGGKKSTRGDYKTRSVHIVVASIDFHVLRGDQPTFLLQGLHRIVQADLGNNQGPHHVLGC